MLPWGVIHSKSNFMKTIVLSAYLKIACILIILIGGGYLVIVGEEILLPLSFAFLISLVLLPVCNFVENKLRFSRSVASIVAVVLLLIMVCIIFYALGSQIADLGKEWPLLKIQVTQLFNDAQAWLSRTFHVNVEQQTIMIFIFKNAIGENKN